MNLRLIHKSEGFTLLEVLVAFFLLSFISLAIYQAMTQSFKLREVLVNDSDFFTSIRLAMGILEKDVALIYSPVIMIPETTSTTPKPSGTPSNPGDPNATNPVTTTVSSQAKRESTVFWSKPTDNTGIRPSRFIASENKLTFIAASHMRVYKDSPESVFAKVTYELRSPDNAPEELKGTLTLYKTVNTNAFELETDEDKLQRVYPLVQGIKKFQYRFYKKSKDQWYGKWDTESADFKNTYPDIIEVNLEVIGPAKLFFEGQYKFRPEIPINGLSSST